MSSKPTFVNMSAVTGSLEMLNSLLKRLLDIERRVSSDAVSAIIDHAKLLRTSVSQSHPYLVTIYRVSYFVSNFLMNE